MRVATPAKRAVGGAASAGAEAEASGEAEPAAQAAKLHVGGLPARLAARPAAQHAATIRPRDP